MLDDRDTSRSGAGVDALAQDLVVTCARFTRSVSRRSMRDSTAVWRTLAILDEHGALRVSDLAELNQCSQPTATGMVQRLEADRRVVRLPDPTDRRATLVSLSPQGRAHLRRLRADASDALAPRLAELPGDRRDELAAALTTIRHLLDTPQSPVGEALHVVSPPAP